MTTRAEAVKEAVRKIPEFSAKAKKVFASLGTEMLKKDKTYGKPSIADIEHRCIIMVEMVKGKQNVMRVASGKLELHVHKTNGTWFADWLVVGVKH